MIHDLSLKGYSMGIAPPATVTIRPRLTVRRIQDVVSQFYDIPLLEMVSERRDWEFSHPRQVAMFLARELTPKSLPDIGRRFGGRDHTTVLHAHRVVQKRIESDPDLAVDVELLRERLAA